MVKKKKTPIISGGFTFKQITQEFNTTGDIKKFMKKKNIKPFNFLK